jgi:hypothetical protein
MIKLAERMVHPPNEYTIRRRFIEALRLSISMKVLELGYNAERHDLQQLYVTAKQLDKAKLYTSVYNRAAVQGDHQCAVKAIRPTRTPAKVSVQVSRPPANKGLHVYRLAIPVVASQLPSRLPYPATAKPAVGI